MADAPDWRLLIPRPVRRLPVDLATVLVIVCFAVITVVVPVINQTSLRVVIGLPFVLFVPGYAFIAVLFPEAGEVSADGAGKQGQGGGLLGRGIDGIERVALSFGLSIAVVPLIGLILNFTPWGIRLDPILIALSGFTLGCVAIATWRRQALPKQERFHVPYRRWFASVRTELFEPDSRAGAVLNVLLVLSVLLAVVSVGYAVAIPNSGESFSELYLLTESESGELVADEYPTNFTAGESQSLTVGIKNHEHEQTSYTVVAQLQRVDREGANNNTSVVVTERQELDRLRTQLAHNETWHQPSEVTPRLTGQNLRLTFLLYRNSPPETPTLNNAYRETYLWVTVTDGAFESTSGG